jgi:hypothetical protein
MFSKRLDRDIRTGPEALVARGELIHFVRFGSKAARILAERRDIKIAERRSAPVTLAERKNTRRAAVAGVLLTASLGAAATPVANSALLPARIAETARAVERVRGRHFERAVPATEIDGVELKKVLRTKLFEGFPASADDTIRTLVALGFIEDTPNLIDRLLDFYASQVVAFYDPEPRRFFLVRGAVDALPQSGETAALGAAGAEKMIFAHELTHALQDESLRLDRRLKELKDNGDRALALESLLEGEATLVMIRVTLADLAGAESAEIEDSLAPLLSAGALEKANVPKDLPDYFVEQLFFPYADGTAYVRRLVKAGGWAAIDRLWKNPPASTSEILHEGATFTPAENLLPAAADRQAPPGFHPLYTDTVGEWGIRFLLRRAMEPAQADPIAAGWRGDRIAFFGSGKSVAYFWRLRFDTPQSAERFGSAWKTARKRSESITRTGTDVIVRFGMSSEKAASNAAVARSARTLNAER